MSLPWFTGSREKNTALLTGSLILTVCCYFQTTRKDVPIFCPPLLHITAVCAPVHHFLLFLLYLPFQIQILMLYKARLVYGTDFFCPFHPPSEWLKIIF